MKYFSLIISFLLFYHTANSQIDTAYTSPPKVSYIVENPVPLINLKDIPLYTGKYVRLIDVVSAHKLLNTPGLLAVGGAYPNQGLTVIVFGKALTWLKANNVGGKKILFSGIISANQENKDAEIFIDDPMLISIIPKH